MTNQAALTGDALPKLITDIPGPRSRELARRLAAVESRNITALQPRPPIFWNEARGANVRDVDGNLFVDLTSGFGVTIAGHANQRVVEAIAGQAARLPHALGDVQPAEIKVRLLEKLAAIMPAPLQVTILANTGAEAVEAALKTALLRTSRPGILAFNGSYHGLTLGALALTHRVHFRARFEEQLYHGVRFAPFAAGPDCDDVLDQVDAICDDAANAGAPIGAIVVEPIQGRGGLNVPASGFLAGLRQRCDSSSRVLIFDEVYSGCGRTGRWLACEHWGVVPDIAVIGKGLSGALPISACIGSEEVMRAWPPSSGEAIHTSTFLGNPIAAAAALAQLEEIEHRGLLKRAETLGHQLSRWADAAGFELRGRGLLQGLVLPSGNIAAAACRQALEGGILMLAEGENANVLAMTPPAVITDEQLNYALMRISTILSRVSP